MIEDRLVSLLNKATPAAGVVKTIFGMDKRSLALFRIGIAAVVLGDIWDRKSQIL
jgi:hypothetical protein